MNIKLFGFFFTAFLATILLAFGTLATDLEISPVNQQVSGTHASSINGNFKVTALENISNIEVKLTSANANLGVAFSPNLFSLTAGSNQTVNFVIAVAPKTPPGQYAIPFTVGSAHTVLGSITLEVTQSRSFSLTNIELSKANKNGSITITNTGNVDLSNFAFSLNADALKDQDGRQITLTLVENNIPLIENNIPRNNLPLIRLGESKNIAVASIIPVQHNLGEFTTTLTAAILGLNATSQIKVINNYCKFGRVGAEIDIQRVKDVSSEDEWEWRPLDEVQVEVKVRNNGDNDEDIEINWDLYDPENQEFIDLDDNEQTLSIDEDATETETILIKVPSDIEDKEYRLYVKAFIEGDENLQCTDLLNNDEFQRVDVQKKSRDVVITNINIPETLSCESPLDITAKLTNIGRNDEDKVKLNVVNQELKVNLESLAFSLDEEDSRTVQLTGAIPQNAVPKAYELNLVALYQYDEDDNVYEKRSDVYKREIIVENCEPSPAADVAKKSVAIAAELLSEVRAGKKISIKVNLRNTGDASTTYSLSISGHEDWATLDKIDPQSITLEKGESKDIIVSLNAKSEASGDNEFILRALYAGKVTEQKVALEIQPEGTDFSQVGAAFKENWFIWLIVLVNIVLIILIIIAARRLSR